MDPPSSHSLLSQPPVGHRILRLGEVLSRTGLGRTTLYELIKVALFPAAVAITGKAVGWLEHEVDEWIVTRPRVKPDK